MDRREFLKTTAGGACLWSLSGLGIGSGRDGPIARLSAAMQVPEAHATSQGGPHEARYYKKLGHKEVQCALCPRECTVGDRERGYCGARENQEGTFYTLVYNRPCTARPDPIEKKPFFHFLPGTFAYSLATAGCNMNCKYCQNWEISQVRPEQVRSFRLTPEECVRRARSTGCISIAYTYTEPVIFWEYMHDISEEARKAGVKGVMISAGFIQERPLRDLLLLLDAVKIDLKAFSDNYYREICKGRLAPVLRTLKIIHEQGVWLEIVYLVLPTLNDSPQEVQGLCKWLLDELGPDVPIHFTRYFPTYLMKNLPPTPVDTLERLYETARAAGLRYVYIGNVPGHPAESTYCPKCGARLIRRMGFNVRIEALHGGLCKQCSSHIPGIWGPNPGARPRESATGPGGAFTAALRPRAT